MAHHGNGGNVSEQITIKSPAEIDAMRVVCRLAAKTLVLAGELVKPGISTEDINTFVHEYTLQQGARCAPLNYHGFPKSVCTSVNEVVCHGIPSKKVILKEGDIINIDVTSVLDGFFGDTSRTFFVGQVSEPVQKLVRVTEECMYRGIATVKPGGRIRDIGAAIEDHAHAHGYGVVRDYTGHGIGRIFHEAPQIPHYRFQGPNPRLTAGMIFTVEPMINLGTWDTELDAKDGWTVRTKDRKWSAQFEHTVLVTPEGHEILTVC